MSTSIDQQFVEFIVKSLVGNPDDVEIKRTIDEKGVLLELTVAPEDLGRVIGKRGATAQSLRTLLRALGTKNDARYNLKIIDNGEAPPKRDDEYRKKLSAEDDQPKSEDQPDTSVSDNQTDESEDDSDDENDMVSKTRKELDDLDDLDI